MFDNKNPEELSEEEARLVKFFYVLVRDHLTPGTINRMLDAFADRGDILPVSFHDRKLAEWAYERIQRLIQGKCANVLISDAYGPPTKTKGIGGQIND